jgi:hypothetical protein
MKTLLALIGLAASLSGCARDHAEATTKPARPLPAGQSVAFTVNASSNGPLFYQWYSNGTNTGGQTNR